jgi:hypothetical protein
LDEAQALAWELQDFRATASESGNCRFGARSGRHDDLVLALAIGAWWVNRPSAWTYVGTYNRGWLLERYGYRTPAEVRLELTQKAA